MNDDSLGVIRRGWPEAAATLAPHVVGLHDLLERRLDEATRTGKVDEGSLMTIVDAATHLAAEDGDSEVANSLGNRLRRTVYEYLLSLDATSQQENRAAGPEVRPAPVMIGGEEIAAMGRASNHEAAASNPGGAGLQGRPAGESSSNPAPEPAWPPSPPPPPPAGNHAIAAGDPTAAADEFGFHIGDPSDLVGQAPAREPDERGSADPELMGPFGAGLDLADHGQSTGDAEAHQRHASFADPSSWPKPGPPTPRPARGHEPGNGSHDKPTADGRGRERPTDPTSLWAALSAVQPSDQDRTAPLTWTEAILDLAQPPAGISPPRVQESPPPPDATAIDGDDPGAAVLAVPGGRRQPTPEPGAGASRRQLGADQVSEDEVSESDLADLRRAIEEKLRKKRCDEAAALLQQAAQDLGGRGVAEVAVDTGDTCRSLGKTNAALNCFLAATRADPLYEPPLSRLADICIDDQDVDLAVSYLERMARLTRLRGDNKSALRIYRKIAAVAPYRDDVVELLMRAQTTGRFDI